MSIVEAGIGAGIGTLVGGLLVWGLERATQSRREKNEAFRQAQNRANDIRQKKAEFMIRQLPGLRTSLYSGEKEGLYFRSHFQDCRNVFEASKVVFESESSKNESIDIDVYYSINSELMMSDPRNISENDLKNRKIISETYAQKIHKILTKEVKYLLEKVSAIEY